MARLEVATSPGIGISPIFSLDTEEGVIPGRSFVLKETGAPTDAILLETGDYMLLE